MENDKEGSHSFGQKVNYYYETYVLDVSEIGNNLICESSEMPNFVSASQWIHLHFAKDRLMVSMLLLYQ